MGIVLLVFALTGANDAFATELKLRLVDGTVVEASSARLNSTGTAVLLTLVNGTQVAYFLDDIDRASLPATLTQERNGRNRLGNNSTTNPLGEYASSLHLPSNEVVVINLPDTTDTIPERFVQPSSPAWQESRLLPTQDTTGYSAAGNYVGVGEPSHAIGSAYSYGGAYAQPSWCAYHAAWQQSQRQAAMWQALYEGNYQGSWRPSYPWNRADTDKHRHLSFVKEETQWENPGSAPRTLPSPAQHSLPPRYNPHKSRPLRTAVPFTISHSNSTSSAAVPTPQRQQTRQSTLQRRGQSVRHPAQGSHTSANVSAGAMSQSTSSRAATKSHSGARSAAGRRR